MIGNERMLTSFKYFLFSRRKWLTINSVASPCATGKHLSMAIPLPGNNGGCQKTTAIDRDLLRVGQWVTRGWRKLA